MDACPGRAEPGALGQGGDCRHPSPGGVLDAFWEKVPHPEGVGHWTNSPGNGDSPEKPELRVLGFWDQWDFWVVLGQELELVPSNSGYAMTLWSFVGPFQL